MSSNLTQDLLHELFEYRDGTLYWKMARGHVKAGAVAGTIGCKNYLHTVINYKPYRNHRLIFFMKYGYLPKVVDHIDGNPLNNKIENLRAATPSQNSRNHKRYKTNSSGYIGVCFAKRESKWLARADLNGRSHFLGYFHTPEDANLAVLSFKNSNYEGFTREVSHKDHK